MTVRAGPAPADRVSSRDWLLAGWVALLSAVLIVVIGHNLGNFPPVSGDDAWIMSASHKLATEGVFGSDMFRGFAGADHDYFIALPVYHFLQAGVFAVFGTGVVQARAVTLASGLVALWCTAWLARRWYGTAVAVIATGLLVIWRTDLMSLADGLSFVSISRTGRYDATALALILLTLVGLELTLARDDHRLAFVTGITAGLATLTQFFGAFALPLLAALLLAVYGWGVRRQKIVYWMTAGWLLIVVPYAIYIARHWADFVSQSELKSGRIEFHQPGFYLDNLLDEPDRYQHLFGYLRPILDGGYHWLDQPLSPFIFGVAVIVALGTLAWRVYRVRRQGDRALAISVAVLAISLALLDGTNARLYSVTLLPLLCTAIAVMLVSVAGWGMRQPLTAIRMAIFLAIVAPAVVVAAEGFAVHQETYVESGGIVAYSDATRQISNSLPADGVSLGSERWWAGLYEDHDYVAITAVAGRWREDDELQRRQDGLAQILSEHGVSAIILDDDARSAIERLPAALRAQFEDVIQQRGNLAGTVAVHPYGQVDILLLENTAAATGDAPGGE